MRSRAGRAMVVRMNELPQALGLALIAVALGAGAVFAMRGRLAPAWGRIAAVVLVVILIALVGLVANSVLAGDVV